MPSTPTPDDDPTADSLLKRPARKRLRLAHFDYASQGAYFITIVTEGRLCLLGAGVDGRIHLNAAGCMVDGAIRRIPLVFPGVSVDEHITMPNHLHVLLDILPDAAQRGVTLVRVAASLKSYTTHAYGVGMRTGEYTPIQGRLWQRGYHDHIVRDPEDYHRIRSYIRSNPFRWCVDRDNPQPGL